LNVIVNSPPLFSSLQAYTITYFVSAHADSQRALTGGWSADWLTVTSE